MKFLLLLAIFGGNAYANPPDVSLHFAAHVGTSFTINTITYGVYKKMDMKYPKTLAFMTTVVIGLAYKLNEHPQDKQIVIPLTENLIGTAASTLTIYTFDF